jgi:hypothetical protein
MVLLSLIAVLRGFYGCGVLEYALPENLCAALINTKNPHFWPAPSSIIKTLQ